MKILHVIPFLTPRRGGSVTAVFNLAKQLSINGHQVTIATTDFEYDSRYADALRDTGVSISVFKSKMNVYEFLYSPSMNVWLRDNTRHFDIVHLHNFRSYQNMIAHRMAKKNGIPVVLQPDASTPRVVSRKRAKLIFDLAYGRRILKNVDMIIAISKQEEEYLRGIGVTRERLVTINTGMDVEYFEQLPPQGTFRQKNDIAESTKLVLYLGRIHESKGLDFLIEAFGKVKDELGDALLAIVGPDDGYRNELEVLISRSKLTEHVKFVGQVSEDEKKAALRDADVFVHAVKYMGGVGIAPLEAILCGTPVVVTKECGEIVDRAACGFVIEEYGDVERLKELILRALVEDIEMQEMVKKGRQYIEENLQWSTVTRRVEEVYENCIRDFQ